MAIGWGLSSLPEVRKIIFSWEGHCPRPEK